MFNRKVIAIDIGDGYIKVLVGSNQRVKLCGLIETPENSVMNNNIIKVEAVRYSINEFLRQNRVMDGYVSFVLWGNDIFVRHLDMPLMEEKSLKKLVEWEIAQSLPDSGRNYYINYEVLKRINRKNNKTCEILVVASPKGKINKFIELSHELGLKLKSIDISANCLARVLKYSIDASNDNISVGIIDTVCGNFRVIILDEGKLFIERELQIGVKNIIKEIKNCLCIDESAACEYLYNEFNINKIGNDKDVDKRVQFIFENALSAFEKVIQFYTRGKIKKSLDSIYISGGESRIAGIEEYTKDFFGCPVYIIGSSETSIGNIKLPKNFDFKNYINALGLLLRKE